MPFYPRVYIHCARMRWWTWGRRPTPWQRCICPWWARNLERTSSTWKPVLWRTQCTRQPEPHATEGDRKLREPYNEDFSVGQNSNKIRANTTGYIKPTISGGWTLPGTIHSPTWWGWSYWRTEWQDITCSIHKQVNDVLLNASKAQEELYGWCWKQKVCGGVTMLQHVQPSLVKFRRTCKNQQQYLAVVANSIASYNEGETDHKTVARMMVHKRRTRSLLRR
jgi:hypothetical protein